MLEASTRDFRTFFEMANVGNVIADARTGQFLRVNRCFCELTGYPEQELLALTSYDLTDPLDIDADRTGWEEAVRRDPPTFTIEKRYRRKDGRTIWVHVTSTLVRDARGEPLHAIGVIRDVTDRRFAMEELEKARAELEARVGSRTAEATAATAAARETADRLRTLIENSPLAIITLDLDYRVQLWNPAAERLFGWTAEEVVGKPLPTLPGDKGPLYEMEPYAKAIAPERLHWETKRQRRDGSVVEIEAWRAPLFDAQGNVIASIAILMDVTERKFLERAMLEATERESRRIGRELHDHLCQHLLGAAFSAKAMAMGQPRESPLSTELEALARLINSAVQQSRDIARGLNPVELDAAGLMTALQVLTDRPKPGIACRLECERDVLLLDAEAALQAYRIAQEAVANAVEHSGATEIVIRLAEDAQGIVLSITDNGKGFDPKAGNHAGLGLEIMRYRAQVISGNVGVHTSPYGGSSVVLSLPKRRP